MDVIVLVLWPLQLFWIADACIATYNDENEVPLPSSYFRRTAPIPSTTQPSTTDPTTEKQVIYVVPRICAVRNCSCSICNETLVEAVPAGLIIPPAGLIALDAIISPSPPEDSNCTELRITCPVRPPSFMQFNLGINATTESVAGVPTAFLTCSFDGRWRTTHVSTAQSMTPISRVWCLS